MRTIGLVAALSAALLACSSGGSGSSTSTNGTPADDPAYDPLLETPSSSSPDTTKLQGVWASDNALIFDRIAFANDGVTFARRCTYENEKVTPTVGAFVKATYAGQNVVVNEDGHALFMIDGHPSGGDCELKIVKGTTPYRIEADGRLLFKDARWTKVRD